MASQELREIRIPSDRIEPRRSDRTNSGWLTHRRLIAMRNAAASATDRALLQHNGDPAVSYFNLEFNPQMATSLVHCLNRRYKGAQKFPVTAPDAQGTLIVWARDPQECREHLMNALFDLIFARNRVGAAITNPPCIFCGGKTQSRGRNSPVQKLALHESGCQRSFVIDRTFRGGINHPTQSKKLRFIIVRRWPDNEGGVRRSRHLDEPGDNWYRKIFAVRKRIDHKCLPARNCATGGPVGFGKDTRTGKSEAHDENRSAVRWRR